MPLRSRGTTPYPIRSTRIRLSRQREAGVLGQRTYPSPLGLTSLWTPYLGKTSQAGYLLARLEQRYFLAE